MRHVKRIMPAHMRACVRPMEDLSINARLGALAVSQDGSLIVVGLGRSVVVLREEYFEERWLKGPNPNMSDHAIVAQLGNLENDVCVVDISANNATVAAAGKEENWAAVLHVIDGSAEVNALYLTRDAQIHGIALSPDGQFVSMTGRDRRATVYDVSGTEWFPVFDFDLTVYLFAYGTCVKFSPAGDMLIVGGDMRKCTVWDVGPDKPMRSEPDGAHASDSRLLKVIGRGGYINAVCFDASGSILALTGGDWKVALYDVANDFALIAEIVMPVQHQHGLAISFPSPPPPPGSPPVQSHPSGHPAFAGLIVAAQSGRESGVLTLTDMATLCPLCELEGVNDVGFARGGLLYCRVGGAVHIYDVNSSGDAIIPESRLGGRVRAMAPNHDGSMIALARMAMVRVYASAQNGIVDELTMPSDVVALAYSPFDTPTVKVVSRLLDRHQIPTELHGRILHDSQLKGKLAALTAKRLLVLAGEPGHLVEVASVKLEHELPVKEEEARHGLRWSSDGSMIAVATMTHALLIDTHTSTIVESKRRDTDTWFSVFRLREQFGPVAAGFGDAAFYRECDIKEKQLKALLMQLGVVRVQAYSMAHDCRHIAVGGNGRLFIFDTATQEAVFELANMGWVMGLVWSADDRFVGVGGHNKTVTVLDVSSGVVFADCGVPRSYWPLVLAFSADGRVVADGNQSFAVYSCDGSRLALSKPLEASPMLRTSAPIWAEDSAGSVAGRLHKHEKHENLLVGLVKAHPQARAAADEARATRLASQAGRLACGRAGTQGWCLRPPLSCPFPPCRHAPPAAARHLNASPPNPRARAQPSAADAHRCCRRRYCAIGCADCAQRAADEERRDLSGQGPAAARQRVGPHARCAHRAPQALARRPAARAGARALAAASRLPADALVRAGDPQARLADAPPAARRLLPRAAAAAWPCRKQSDPAAGRRAAQLRGQLVPVRPGRLPRALGRAHRARLAARRRAHVPAAPELGRRGHAHLGGGGRETRARARPRVHRRARAAQASAPARPHVARRARRALGARLLPPRRPLAAALQHAVHARGRAGTVDAAVCAAQPGPRLCMRAPPAAPPPLRLQSARRARATPARRAAQHHVARGSSARRRGAGRGRAAGGGLAAVGAFDPLVTARRNQLAAARARLSQRPRPAGERAARGAALARRRVRADQPRRRARPPGRWRRGRAARGWARRARGGRGPRRAARAQRVCRHCLARVRAGPARAGALRLPTVRAAALLAARHPAPHASRRRHLARGALDGAGAARSPRVLCRGRHLHAAAARCERTRRLTADGARARASQARAVCARASLHFPLPRSPARHRMLCAHPPTTCRYAWLSSCPSVCRRSPSGWRSR